jgi:hypothetical protein
MCHNSSIQALELITGCSYLMILLGFTFRAITEGRDVKLLWPWMLVSIFGLCGLTRLNYVGIMDFPTGGLLHFILAMVAMSYGVAQLLYAVWPELFADDDGVIPHLSKEF